MPTPLYRVSAATLNLRAAADIGAKVIGQLSLGQRVERVAPDQDTGDWWQVRATDRAAAETGYAARRYLELFEQHQHRPMPDVARQRLWDLTADAIRRKVSYKMGARDSASGAIDCSGWVGEILGMTFSAVNAAAQETVFHAADIVLLKTISDAIIANVAAATGFIETPTDLRSYAFQAGQCVGFDTGEHDWEKGSRRKFGIDHVVAVIADPNNPAQLYISQSSSRSGGVGLTKLGDWETKMLADVRVKPDRIWVVDPFMLADYHTAFMTPTPQPAQATAVAALPADAAEPGA